MDLGVYCDCGDLLPVVESQFDGAIQCRCGRRVVVPSREEFLAKPFLLSSTSIERRVSRLVAAGELPPSGGCAACSRTENTELVPVSIDCERYTTHSSGGRKFFLIPFPFLFFITWREKERLEFRGRDTEVETPLILCGDCHRELARPVPKMRAFQVGCFLIALATTWSVREGVGFNWFVSVLMGFGGLVCGLLAVNLRHRIGIKSRQNEWKRILRQVPIYRQIILRYPKLIVEFPPVRSTIPK